MSEACNNRIPWECLNLTLTPKNATPEHLLKELLRAYFVVEIDGDGDVVVRETIRIYVAPQSKRFIRLMTVWKAGPEADESAVRDFCERINGRLVAVRADATCHPVIILDWHLPLAGGLPIRTLVMSIRHFADISRDIEHLDFDSILRRESNE